MGLALFCDCRYKSLFIKQERTAGEMYNINTKGFTAGEMYDIYSKRNSIPALTWALTKCVAKWKTFPPPECLPSHKSNVCLSGTERERERERERGGGEADRQTETGRERGRQTDRERGRETERQTDRQTETDRPTDREIDRELDHRFTGCLFRL